MHSNENKYNELFRDRFRDHSHPVGSDLWSRIRSGIGSGPVIRPFSKTFFFKAALQLWRPAAAFAAVGAVTAGVIVGVLAIMPVEPAKVVGTAAGGGSPRGTGTVGGVRSEARGGAAAGAATGARSGAGIGAGSVAVAGSGAGGGGSDSGAGAGSATGTGAVSAGRSDSMRGVTAGRQYGAKRGYEIKRRGEREVKEAEGSGKGEKEAGGSGKGQGERESAARREIAAVRLPALASMGTRAAITMRRALVPRSWGKVLGSGGKAIGSGLTASKSRMDTGRFHRTGYVSLYASPDFPNHYYTWSYTTGVRLTFLFSPRWSFTAGFEYDRVNVPTQVVPPVGYGDTLHAFYFSNYEVPILFGYRKTFGRSELAVNGGAILNLYFHRSTGVWVFNWPDRGSYGAVLGVDYSYALSRHLALFGQPYGRFSISNYRMFIPAQRLSFGTLLGVRYRL